MGYLFRGQDRRDLSKTIMAGNRVLARDTTANNPKKTTAISTRQMMLDNAAHFDGPERQEFATILGILKVKKMLKVGYTPATFTLTVVGGVITAVAVSDGGSYPGVEDGFYEAQVFSDTDLFRLGVIGCTVASGVVTVATVQSGGNGYVSPYVGNIYVPPS